MAYALQRSDIMPTQTPTNPQKQSQPNEGEGNRTAARHYNEATRKYVQSGKPEKAAQEAKRAVDGPEGEELRKAEEEGRNHAAVHDDEE